MTTGVTSKPPARAWRRRLTSLPAVAGIGYSVAWIVSFLPGAPMPGIAEPGSRVVTDYASHGGSTAANFALAEGVAAAFLVIVVISVAGAARRSGAPRAGLAAAGFGIASAVVSLTELGLGAWLIGGPVPGRQPGTAGAIWHAINRIDGAKMFLLAAMAVAIAVVAARTVSLPRWLTPLGYLTGAALVVSGLGYILLATGLATSVWASGILLLVLVTAAGVTLEQPGP